MYLRLVVWPVIALWKTVVLCAFFVVALPAALWLTIGELRTWKRRVA